MFAVEIFRTPEGRTALPELGPFDRAHGDKRFRKTIIYNRKIT